jgi:hypothetical protein
MTHGYYEHMEKGPPKYTFNENDYPVQKDTGVKGRIAQKEKAVRKEMDRIVKHMHYEADKLHELAALRKSFENQRRDL